jgi:hypothetical protein
MAESNLFSFIFEDISGCVAQRELYSDSDMITIPLSLPRFIIKVSKFFEIVLNIFSKIR